MFVTLLAIYSFSFLRYELYECEGVAPHIASALAAAKVSYRAICAQNSRLAVSCVPQIPLTGHCNLDRPTSMTPRCKEAPTEDNARSMSLIIRRKSESITQLEGESRE